MKEPANEDKEDEKSKSFFTHYCLHFGTKYNIYLNFHKKSIDIIVIIIIIVKGGNC
jgi:hypothetical protein